MDDHKKLEAEMAKMVELKTSVNDASVEGFLNSVTEEQKRSECFYFLNLIEQATQTQARQLLNIL